MISARKLAAANLMAICATQMLIKIHASQSSQYDEICNKKVVLIQITEQQTGTVMVVTTMRNMSQNMAIAFAEKLLNNLSMMISMQT